MILQALGIENMFSLKTLPLLALFFAFTEKKMLVCWWFYVSWVLTMLTQVATTLFWNTVKFNMLEMLCEKIFCKSSQKWHGSLYVLGSFVIVVLCDRYVELFGKTSQQLLLNILLLYQDYSSYKQFYTL